MSKPRVFVIEPTRVDVSAASRHGDVVQLYYPNESRPSIWSSDYVPDVVQRLDRHDYLPQHDHVLMAGPLVHLVMVTSALMVLFPGEVIKVLYFDASTRSYVQRYLGCSQSVRMQCEAILMD